MLAETQERRRIRVSGTVQGVGFRPFVYRVATELGLSGFVLNDSRGVLIEVQGTPDSINSLLDMITSDPPVLARVENIQVEAIQVEAMQDEAMESEPGKLRALGTEMIKATSNVGFTIRKSQNLGIASSSVSIDSATCVECLSEVDDPTNRRYRYPFTNCTNCGPRYTITTAVPYDRPSTTMAKFTMCHECQREYDSPSNRRFHAQPNGCPKCGPHLELFAPGEVLIAEGDDAVVASLAGLRQGKVVALKGLGGYQLAVDAMNADGVHLLRTRKGRFEKPFAVMVPDIAWAHSLCNLSDEHVRQLCSVRRPIVIAPAKADSGVTEEVAPGLGELGVFLPNTPLHHLILKDFAGPLVMTSGNLTDDPIAYEDQDAMARLGPIADLVLTHNRPIYIRCDDSVVKITSRGSQLLRRARGFTPESFVLSDHTSRQILAVGAELKNTVAVAKQDFIVTSQHIGDLEHLSTYQSFLHTIDHLCRLYGVNPEVVAFDLHPEYLSTKLAQSFGMQHFVVQHHHAHIASCLLDNRSSDRVIGVAFDGLGLGSDDTLWGGEWLMGDLSGFERVAHLAPAILPGGTRAIKEPWRMAISWLSQICLPDELEARAARLDPRYKGVIGLIQSGTQPVTSSMGRLFDTVASLLGVRYQVSYEGQGAIELEALARTAEQSSSMTLHFEYEKSQDQLVATPISLLRELIDAQDNQVPRNELALAFHRGVAKMTVEVVERLCNKYDLETAALSGGVFQNTILSDLTTSGLERIGIKALTNSLIPPNDGGISAGQAAIAAWHYRN